MKQTRAWAFCCALVVTVSAAVSLVSANDSAINEGAFGPEPVNVSRGEESEIEMLGENLTFRYGAESTSVIARFRFRNTDERKKVKQLIGFPDLGAAARRDPDTMGRLPNTQSPLRNMQTYVDGKRASSTLRYGYVNYPPNANYWIPSDPKHGFAMAWHTIEVVFQPRQEIVVERRYLADHGSFPYWFYVFEYVTHTGATWKGKIGELRAEVFLEDYLTVNDLTWVTCDGGDFFKLVMFPFRAWQGIASSKMGRALGYYLWSLAGEDNSSKIVISPPRDEWRILSNKRMELVWRDFKPKLDADKQRIRLVTEFGREDALTPLKLIPRQFCRGLLMLLIGGMTLGTYLKKVRGLSCSRVGIGVLVATLLGLLGSLIIYESCPLPQSPILLYRFLNLPAIIACAIVYPLFAVFFCRGLSSGTRSYR